MPEQAVAHAAAGQEDAGHTVRHETFQSLKNATGDEVGGRAQNVVQAPLVLPGQFESLGNELVAEFVFGQNLRRAALQGGVGEPLLQERFDAAALHRVFAADVARFPAARQTQHQIVEQILHGLA